MIISASYRTDIPAFYGTWFMQMLEKGSCKITNPWSRKPYVIDLRPEAVDGFVLWTRNLRPLFPHLATIRFYAPFYVHYTVTNYPRSLDQGTPSSEWAIRDIWRIYRQFGRNALVWRYDPILITSLTPIEWHIRNFSNLAAGLEGAVNEVVVSFTNFYKKTQRNLKLAAAKHRFSYIDPAPPQKQHLLREFAEISIGYGMKLNICAQPQYTDNGIGAAKCIDAIRLSHMGDYKVSAPVKGNRPGCMCDAARDIGTYNSCPHGCVYCYAVQDRMRAKLHHKQQVKSSKLRAPYLTF